MHNINVVSPLSDVISGAILLAFIYHVVLFKFNKDKLLLHYIFYLFLAALFSFFRTGIANHIFDIDFKKYYLENINEPFQIIYFISYFNFIVQSIELSSLKRTFLYKSWLFILSILFSYALIYFVGKSFQLFDENTIIFITVRIFIFIITSVMLWQCFQLKHLTFQLFILIGSFFYFIFGLISFISNINFTEKMFIYPIEWILIGNFIDIIFFSVAMSYRSNKQWARVNLQLLKDAEKNIELQKAILEKHKELENERGRIASELHDDLGSGLTKITYLSQLALKNSQNKNEIQKINKTSFNLVENMREIIWAMKEENNTLEDLLTYIKMYAVEFFDMSVIKLEIAIPEIIPSIEVKGEIRRYIFLTTKEALNNIIKHAKATNTYLKIEISEKLLIIIIKDNGVGFDTNLEIKKRRHGLSNMEMRISSIGGNISISSSNGTSIILSIPIDQLCK